MKKLALLLSLLLSGNVAQAGSVTAYVILANVNDDKLVLEDSYGQRHVISPKIFCFSWQGFDSGDIVYSTENLDACTSSTLISKRTHRTCDVYCF